MEFKSTFFYILNVYFFWVQSRTEDNFFAFTNVNKSDSDLLVKLSFKFLKPDYIHLKITLKALIF